MASAYRGGYSISRQEATHFLTATVVDWIELFIRPQLADVVVESLRYCIAQKGLEVHGWCLMPNHLHLLCTQPEGRLSDVLRDFKRHTATTILNFLSTNQVHESRKRWLMQRLELAAMPKAQNHKVWQAGNHAIECSERYMVDQRLAYIHDNPVKAGFVYEPHHYRYSSAVDYNGGQGLLPLVLL